MNTVRILHSADFHIGSERSHISGGRSDILTAFMRVCELCKSERADFFLIAGDLFDTPYPEKSDANAVFDAVAALDSEVIAVSGNHDFSCEGSVWHTASLPNNLHLFDRGLGYIDFPQKNTRIWGAGFSSRYSDTPPLGGFSVPDNGLINIGILHADIASSQSRYSPIDSAQISESGLDYLALGHIHKRSRIDRMGSTYCSYCGSPIGRGFDETGSHGVYLGKVGSGFCELSYREIPARMYLSVKADISGAESAFSAVEMISAAIREKYGESFADHLYRITLCGVTDLLPQISLGAVRAALDGRINCCDIFDRTAPSDARIAALANESSLRGIFVSKILEKIHGAVSDTEREELLSALRIGVNAFETEVMPYDN